ncbi:hypothetical protein WJ24_07165 [Burkholderia vietnamiensis]|uniref:hypothetical protein n=1 Tax=Burkholderia vietnamiensis TaxID=60552 RepID=UPI0007582F08|nr:hypothetical protein [Burkholderia vietnamiensis]KVG11879.1 hypothetical protein WJ24_07165 [Burkholderia vietnamiensis]HDR9200143.1 hypothetical protein [Burkholderia vietnamiensis]HDR9204989.1 hypothetical protein [Burkholderia vietnamiensis]HDR9359147.1 hypothetical protein [Burkholderia vietnamiensis]
MIHRTADPSSRPRVCAALPCRRVRRMPLAMTVSPDYMKTTDDGTLSVALKPPCMARVDRRDFADARSARSTRSDDFAPLIRRVVALGASGSIERHAQRKPATPLPAIHAAGRARVRGLFRIES